MFMKKIVVIGGGVSGLIAAIHAKNKNNQVIILERNNTCGKKILVTGNGRCNYSNSNQDINHYHSSSSDNLESIINQKNISAFLDFYKSIGIIPKVKNGYYYPYSNQAVTVQQALLRKVCELDIDVKTSTYVDDITVNGNSFKVKNNNGIIDADIVIMACGGKSYSKLGTDGNGYQLLKKLGHNIIQVVPALTQIKVLENIKDLTGVRSEVSITLIEDGKTIKSEIGEVQFTDYGISGICSMQLSKYISYGIMDKKCEKIVINYVSDIAKSKEEFIKFIESNNWLDFEVGSLLDSLLNYKVTNYILKETKIAGNVKIRNLNDEEIDILVNYLINFTLTATGTNTFDNSQVSAGGVDLKEIDLTTMESKIIPNLYIVGEIVDVDGDCGGYNITFASISGMLAGMEVNKND